MLKLTNGQVFLAEGENIPVFCKCGNVYQPTAGTDFSDCPRCGTTNLHAAEAGPILVPFKAND